MPSVCVDASLILMMMLPDELSENAENQWALWRHEHFTILGPPLLYAEVSSVLRGAVYFGRISSEEGDSAFESFCDMNIAVTGRRDLHIRAWSFAKDYNRPRVYDSFYLAAARAEECELWTGDRRLSNAVNLPWVVWVGS